ncbi:MAG: CAP domain-containing protein [Pseudomonadota bacterium]
MPDSAYDIGWNGISEEEQLITELVNRARLDPTGEVARQGVGFASGVDGSPKEALAVVETLSDAADVMSQDMDARNFFDHTDPDGGTPADRAVAAGHENRFVGENIGWAGSTGRLDDPQARAEIHHDSLWESPGHQRNLMSDNWSEVGIGYDYGDFVTGGVNYTSSTFVTEKFGDTGKAYLTGVVIDDEDGDNFYDMGEGQGGVRITAWNDDGVFATATWASGGYTLELPPGTYNVAFEGGELDGVYETQVTIGSENVKLDVIEDRDAVGAVASSLEPAPVVELNVLSAPPEDPMAAAIDHLLHAGVDDAALLQAQALEAQPDDLVDDMEDA